MLALTRRPTKALSALFVKTANKPGKYFDGYGLYLLIRPNGSRFWLQRITIRNKRCEIGLGAATLVPLVEAREQAIENYKIARSGGDPISTRKQEKAILTFEEAAREVYRIHKPTWKNPKHAAQFISTLETYAFPRIGKIRISDVTANDILSVLTPIWNEKHETAKRLRQRIGLVLKWAIAKGWRLDNPADNVNQALPKVTRQKNHRKALPYAQVADCIRTVQKSNAGITTKLAIEFLILTASRSGEVRGAQWSEIDIEQAVWEIPAERMKMKRPHRVPLCDRAIAILQAAKAYNDQSELIFPAHDSSKSLSDMTLSKLIKELGYNADIHGFRTSFRMWTQEQTNYPRDVAEMALAHRVGSAVEQAYARSDLFEKRRKMMQDWMDFVSSDAL